MPRKLLNIIEIIISNSQVGKPVIIDNALVKKVLQENIALYDKNGEQQLRYKFRHFIKSMRGVGPKRSRLLAGKNDCRRGRSAVHCTENGDSRGRGYRVGQSQTRCCLHKNCFECVHNIGMPEGRIPLAETAIYLATSPKSNSAYMAIDSALELVKREGDLPVPLHLRNAPTKTYERSGLQRRIQVCP